MASQQDIYRLAVEVGCHERTVRRWLNGEQVIGPTTYALTEAAKKLGIEATPKVSPEPETATG